MDKGILDENHNGSRHNNTKHIVQRLEETTRLGKVRLKDLDKIHVR